MSVFTKHACERNRSPDATLQNFYIQRSTLVCKILNIKCNKQIISDVNRVITLLILKPSRLSLNVFILELDFPGMRLLIPELLLELTCIS